MYVYLCRLFWSMRYLSKYIRKSWSFYPPRKTLSWSKHIGILLIHSKKRRAVQPIPIQVDRFSKLIPRHLAKVDTTGRREGEGEGFPEFWASFCIISNIFFLVLSDKALALPKYFLKPNLREAAIRLQVEPSGLGGSYMICAIPVWSIIWNLVARERMMS